MAEMTDIKDVAKETVDILKYFDSTFVSKIPNNFLETLNELAQSSTICVDIDKTKKLKEQNISEQCKDMIALIYYSYIATEEEKKTINDIWNQNEIVYQKKIFEQYNPENLFESKNHINRSTKENMKLIEYKKESFFEKILNKIKNLIKKRA